MTFGEDLKRDRMNLFSLFIPYRGIMGCGIGGGGDSGLWNEGGHPSDTLTEMACLSGHRAYGVLPSCKRSLRSLWRLGAATYPLNDTDQSSSDFGIGMGDRVWRRN